MAICKWNIEMRELVELQIATVPRWNFHHNQLGKSAQQSSWPKIKGIDIVSAFRFRGHKLVIGLSIPFICRISFQTYPFFILSNGN
jgi:hypothetical protein